MDGVAVENISYSEFQSLFSWNLLLMLPFCYQATNCQNVSILVFVELALDANDRHFNLGGFEGFNPCFRGTCSWWSISVDASTYDEIVSILVFVELALDDELLGDDIYILPAFQSLFSWNLLLMLILYVRVGDLIDSFNPCFRGTCSWCAIEELLALAEDRFNPCFRGTCSWCQKATRITDPKWSVSILVFVELALDDDWAIRHNRGIFLVSILVFVELALDVEKSEEIESFLTSVSILVFVELALDVRDTSYINREDFEFQSLFSWNLLLMPTFLQPFFKPELSFNPCFRGTCSWCSPPVWRPASCYVSILVFVELALDGKLYDPIRGPQFMFQSLFSWNLLLMRRPVLVPSCPS